jgi:hypothetical protein
VILFKALNIPPADVRGIGIHLTKLSLPGQSSVQPVAPAVVLPGAPGRPRQVTLSPVVKSSVRPPALQRLAPRALQAGDEVAVVKQEEVGELLLPPAEEVDAEVFDALPAELREEMERSYSKGKQTKREQALTDMMQLKVEKKVHIYALPFRH